MRRVLVTSLLVASTITGVSPGSVRAFDPPTNWPACVAPTDQKCVELLEVTAPGAASPTSYGAAAQDGFNTPTGPVVSAMEMAGAVPMLNVNITTPALSTHATGYIEGLADGVWHVVLRTGAFDPSILLLSADPTAVKVTKGSDGNFKVDVSGRPVPFVGISGTDPLVIEATTKACISASWDATCEANYSVLRHFSFSALTHPTASERDTVRGSWVATNASQFTTPQIDVANRKFSAQAAGPHYVPTDFPTTGLTAENGRYLNPAFYKAYVPWTVLTAMLDRAPAEMKALITPDLVKATITEQAAKKDLTVTLATSDDGLTITLPITHFSAPNPEIVFSRPGSSTTPPASSNTPSNTSSNSSSSPTASAGYVKGKTASVSSIITVPSGARVSAVKSSTTKVCTASGTRLKFVSKGKCTFTVTLKKGTKSSSVKKSITVS